MTRLPPYRGSCRYCSRHIPLVAAIALAAGAAAVSTFGLPYLPHQIAGDDYFDLVASGVAPVVKILTIAALAVVWLVTRVRRTVLKLWLAVGLALLAFDNIVTMVGGARASVGWYAGRVEALVSAFAVLFA